MENRKAERGLQGILGTKEEGEGRREMEDKRTMSRKENKGRMTG